MIEKREETIRKWFHMWLTKNSSVINEIFADSAVYTESWGPEYHGAEKIKLWFDEWIRGVPLCNGIFINSSTKKIRPSCNGISDIRCAAKKQMLLMECH